MKTQIANLVNGRVNVRRNDNDVKYVSAISLTNKSGYSGSSIAMRQDIGSKVVEENPERLDIEIQGKVLHLARHSSCSGKTVWYSADLTPEEHLAIMGEPYPSHNEWCSIIMIDMLMYVNVTRFMRKSEKAQWKKKASMYIGEELVKIL